MSIGASSAGAQDSPQEIQVGLRGGVVHPTTSLGTLPDGDHRVWAELDGAFAVDLRLGSATVGGEISSATSWFRTESGIGDAAGESRRAQHDLVVVVALRWKLL